MTWSVRRLCSSSRSFTSRFQICDPTNIRWVAIENPVISRKMCLYFTATQQISVGSQIWKLEVKEWLEMHNVRTDRVMIRSELKYLIGAKVAGTLKIEPWSVYNPAKTRGFRSGPGNNPAKKKHFGSLARIGTEPKRRPKTGPLAGYRDLLLTLTGIDSPAFWQLMYSFPRLGVITINIASIRCCMMVTFRILKNSSSTWFLKWLC